MAHNVIDKDQLANIGNREQFNPVATHHAAGAMSDTVTTTPRVTNHLTLWLLVGISPDQIDGKSSPRAARSIVVGSQATGETIAEADVPAFDMLAVHCMIIYHKMTILSSI